MIILTGDGALQLDLDIVTSIQHNGTSVVTDYTVEKGVNVADHSRPEPDTVSIEGVVTDTPLDAPVFGFDGVRRQLDDGVLVWDGAVRRRRAVQEELTRLRVTGEQVTVLTPTREYSNMVIVSSSFSQVAEMSGKLEVSLEFRQVRTAALRFVALPEPVEPRGQKFLRRGKQFVKSAGQEVLDTAVNIATFGFVKGV